MPYSTPHHSFYTQSDLASDKGFATTLRRAVDLHEAGHLEQAGEIYETLLKNRPDHPDVQHMLGLVHMQRDNHERAVTYLEKAVESDSPKAGYFKNLGIAYQNMGRAADSETMLRNALKLAPKDPTILYNLGRALDLKGEPHKALDIYSKSTSGTTHPEALNNAGLILLRLKKHDEAQQMFEKAIHIKPDSANAYSNLGLLYHEKAQPVDALKYAMAAIHLEPEIAEHKVRLTSIVQQDFVIDQFNADMKRIITHCLGDKRVKWDAFSKIWAKLFLLDPAFEAYRKTLDAKDYSEFKDQFEKIENTGLFADDFLIKGVKSLLLNSPGIERLLTLTRRYALEKIAKGRKSDLPEPLKIFLFALAEKCYYSEYVYYVTDDEKSHFETLKHKVTGPTFSASRSWPEIAVFACYEALFELENAQKITQSAKRSQNAELKALVNRQIREPEEEGKIYKRLESITENRAESGKYHEIYDAYPYPKWKSTNIQIPTDELYAGYDETINREDYMRILVAGCGTGQHAMTTALAKPRAEVLGVDFSASTLAYAERMRQEYGVKNISYQQGDIMAMDTLEPEQFEIVECAGVIHHIDDYRKAFKILRDLTKPGGLLRIGVYSKTARERSVPHAQELIKKHGYRPDIDGIREARQKVMSAPIPAIRSMAQSPDFYSMNARYHIFDMDEHWFTIAEIQDILQELNLTFKGFNLRSPRDMEKFKARFSEDADPTDFAQWDIFERENPSTFAGMYNLILKKDRADN